MELVPPSTLPTDWLIVRPLSSGSGSLSYDPRKAWIGFEPGPAHWNLDPGITVAISRFHQQNTISSGFGEPRSKDTTRRTGANHDVVENVLNRCHVFEMASISGQLARDIRNARKK
jgi:hypothetical protein